MSIIAIVFIFALRGLGCIGHRLTEEEVQEDEGPEDMVLAESDPGYSLTRDHASSLSEFIAGHSIEREKLGCRNLNLVCDGQKVATIKRGMTNTRIVKKIFKTIFVVALILTVIAASLATAGLFDIFLTGPGVLGFSWSGHAFFSSSMGTWYSASLATGFALLAGGMMGVGGFASGTLLTMAAHKVGADSAALERLEKIKEDVKWLGEQKDTCGMVHFDFENSSYQEPSWVRWQRMKGKRTGLWLLEGDSDTPAHEAVSTWCSVYQRYGLFNEEDGVMPLPKACKQLDLPDGCSATNSSFEFDEEDSAEAETFDEEVPKKESPKKESTKKKKKEKSMTCADLLGLADAEMSMQAAVMRLKMMQRTEESVKEASKVKDGDCEGTDPVVVEAEKMVEKDSKRVCPGESAEDMLRAVKKANEAKARAQFDCLAVSSCQLLRKSLSKIQGKEKNWYGGLKKNGRTHLVQHVVEKCLSHTLLMGPEKGLNLYEKGCTASEA